MTTLIRQNTTPPQQRDVSRPDSVVGSKIVTAAAYKGGVGKTTLALELAYLLSAPLVDFDWDQGGASRRWGYRYDKHATRPLLDALFNDRVPRPIAGRRKADLVPGHPALSEAGFSATDVTGALIKWAAEWGREWTVVDTHPGGFSTTLGAMAAADVIVVPAPLTTGEIDGLEGMLQEASDYPLLIVPNKVTRMPAASLNRRLWALAEDYDVPLGPVISKYDDLGTRQQRLAVSALKPTPSRWARYVAELRAVAQAVETYGDN